MVAYRARVPHLPPLRVEIAKRIPVAAGLGGGSADAAAVLRAANQIAGEPLGDPMLRSIGAGIGSDVPSQIAPGHSLVAGVGEVVEPLALPPLALVLVPAAEGLATAAVFAELDRLGRFADALDREPLRELAAGSPADLAAGLANDLQPAALSLRPELAETLERLRAAGALGAQLSGSGPTAFGRLRRRRHGRRGGGADRGRHPHGDRRMKHLREHKGLVAVAVVVIVLIVLYNTGVIPHLPDIEGLIEDVAQSARPLDLPARRHHGVPRDGRRSSGSIAPGETTVIIGGVVAGQGEISLVFLIGLVWVCCVLGDTTSFFIGRRLGRDFLLRHGPKIRIDEKRVAQVEDYFQRHGGKTILIGRFVGLVRALAPFVAGSSGLALPPLPPVQRHRLRPVGHVLLRARLRVLGVVRPGGRYRRQGDDGLRGDGRGDRRDRADRAPVSGRAAAPGDEGLGLAPGRAPAAAAAGPDRRGPSGTSPRRA